ncbi:Hypothetical predicted protein [Pelobates cultripes]|uniref:Uncharacterized protein n=1 Tax=Pelobates cultripes TaxID=61616 RepID=A0AAD1RIW0_PELCU|nr:Hypothetical predicted protein [Pelobates cultripes]
MIENKAGEFIFIIQGFSSWTTGTGYFWGLSECAQLLCLWRFGLGPSTELLSSSFQEMLLSWKGQSHLDPCF